MIYPEDVVQQIVTEMIESPDYVWWFNEDTGVWHARQQRLGIERTSEVDRDHALMWLYHALHDPQSVRAYRDGITQTGA